MCSDGLSSTKSLPGKSTGDDKPIYSAKFVKELEKFIPNLKLACFLGGEPFLIEIYYQIWERIIEINPGCSIYVQTNATVLNDRIKSILNKGKFFISVSLDALDKTIYETIRINADHDKVMQNICYFDEYSKKNKKYLIITVCIIQQNWQELPKLLEFCNKYNLQIFFNKVNDPENCSLKYLSSEKLLEIFNYYKTIVFPENNELQTINKIRTEAFIGYIREWYQDSLKSK